MATNVIDNFLVQFGLDARDLEKGFAQLQTTLKSVDNMIKATTGYFVAMFAKNQIEKIADMSLHFDLLSKKTGISAEEIQSWGNAVKIQGGTVESFESTLQYLSNEMQSIAINGNSSLVPMITRLGIAYRNVGGSLKSPIQLLRELSVRFQGLSNQQAFSLAKKLGLDDGTVLLLQKGEKGIDEILTKTRKLNALNEKDIKTGIELRKSWKEFGLVIQKLAVQFGALFLPVAQKLSDWGGKFADWMDKHGENVKNVLEGIAIVLGVSLIPKIAALAKLVVGNPWIAVLGAAITGFLALFDDYKVWKDGGDSLINWGKAFGYLSEMASKCWDVLKSFWDWLADSWLGKGFEYLSKGIKSIWEAMGGGNNNISDEIDESIRQMLEEGLSNKEVKDHLVDSGLSEKEMEERIAKQRKALQKPKVSNNPEKKIIFKFNDEEDEQLSKIPESSDKKIAFKFKEDAQKLLVGTNPVSPIASRNISNTTNTTTTSIGNVNITAEKVDGDSIKNLGNTVSKQKNLALQSNYGM